MGCAPFSLLTKSPLFPCSEMVPSALLIQVKVSHAWKVGIDRHGALTFGRRPCGCELGKDDDVGADFSNAFDQPAGGRS